LENKSAASTTGGNFDEFKIGRRLHEKRAVATWNLGTISAFDRRQRKTKKTCVEMAGRRTSGCILTTSQQPGKQKLKKVPWPKVSLTCVVALLIRNTIQYNTIQYNTTRWFP
jgi:hypothetical protein